MAGATHHYEIEVRWTGNLGPGTVDYRAYSRDHEIGAAGKAERIACSSDPVFRGSAARYNPEELLVASLSACHMLWVLHLCADANIIVTSYSDRASGTMITEPDGSGRFTEVVLNPRMTITEAGRVEDAIAVHEKAHGMCFVANSVTFPVRHQPQVTAR
jgi:organic hydroperoxide reductase OsmC/OhrA